MGKYTSRITIACDGFEEQGDDYYYHLNFLVPDLDKLKRFIQGAAAGSYAAGDHFIVHAFPEHAAALRNLDLSIHLDIVEHDITPYYEKAQEEKKRNFREERMEG
jgi:hypothetical protein